MTPKKTALILGCCLALVCFLSALALAEAEPKAGQMVSIKFPKPMSDEDATYLGLPKAEEFTVKDVKAPFLLVEQFNTTCPHCMAQAPALNSLYAKVQSDPQLKEKLKFMAMGQGNDESAIKMWKAFNKVPFPLFPDPNSTFGKALNFSPYPVSVVLDKTGKIVWAHVGAFDSADETLQEIKTAIK